MLKTTGDVIKDFVLFAQAQYDCLDYDPFHPVMHRLENDMPRWKAMWASTFYMAFYNPASAIIALEWSELTPTSVELPEWAGQLPIGLQRRNLRGGLVVDYFQRWSEQLKRYDSLEQFLTKDFQGEPKADWYHLQDTLCEVWGNGRWSAYTLGELYQKVNNLPVWPDCIGNEGSSGPRAGIQCVMGEVEESGKAAVPLLDAKADTLFEMVRPIIKTSIPYLPDNHLDYAMLESELCDFQSLQKGRYYIGRDVDRMQDRIQRTIDTLIELGLLRDMIPLLDRVWGARYESFDKKFLGESNDWQGMSKEAKQFYRDHGFIACHKDIREYLGL